MIHVSPFWGKYVQVWEELQCPLIQGTVSRSIHRLHRKQEIVRVKATADGSPTFRWLARLTIRRQAAGKQICILTRPCGLDWEPAARSSPTSVWKGESAKDIHFRYVWRSQNTTSWPSTRTHNSKALWMNSWFTWSCITIVLRVDLGGSSEQRPSRNHTITFPMFGYIFTVQGWKSFMILLMRSNRLPCV